MLEYCTSNVHLGLFSCCVGDFHRIHVTYKQVPHMDDSMEGPMKNPMFVGSISKIPMFALFLEKSDFSRVPISKNPMFALCLLKIRLLLQCKGGAICRKTNYLQRRDNSPRKTTYIIIIENAANGF